MHFLPAPHYQPHPSLTERLTPCLALHYYSTRHSTLRACINQSVRQNIEWPFECLRNQYQVVILVLHLVSRSCSEIYRLGPWPRPDVSTPPPPLPSVSMEHLGSRQGTKPSLHTISTHPVQLDTILPSTAPICVHRCCQPPSPRSSTACQLGSAPGPRSLLKAHRDLAPCLVPPAPMKSRGPEKRDEQHFPGSTPIDIDHLWPWSRGFYQVISYPDLPLLLDCIFRLSPQHRQRHFPRPLCFS